MNAQGLKTEHAAAYLKAKAITWITPEQALAADATRQRIAAFIASGGAAQSGRKNVTASGMAGAAQMFARLGSEEVAQQRIASFRQKAREHRLNGLTKEAALCDASANREQAALDAKRAPNLIAAE